MVSLSRGEVWHGDLSPIRGHEQAGSRPLLVISDDLFNRGPAGVVVVIPLTSRIRRVPLHVTVEPPEGGLRTTSVIQCEAIRSISKERLKQRLGRVSSITMAAVEDRLRILLCV